MGNVRAVVSDVKVATVDGSGNITNLTADVVSATDYYPFGMQMPGRVYKPDYRYGFNGMEKDDEVSGEGNSYTAMFWQYDSRLGRRWNIDPVVAEWESPYAAFRNNPIVYNDPNGDCPDCDENNPDAEAGTIYRPEGAEHDYIKGKDGEWTGVGGDLPEITVAAGGNSYPTANPSMGNNNNTGYVYNEKDLSVRKNILSTKNPIATYIKSREEDEIFEILNADDYWKYYGHTLGNMLLMDSYIRMADMTLGGSVGALRTPKGFNLTSRLSSSSANTVQGVNLLSPVRPKLLLPPYRGKANSWNDFLHVNKGRFKGKDWVKRASEAYKWEKYKDF